MSNKTTTDNKSNELNCRIEKMEETDIETVKKIESEVEFPWKKKNSFLKYVERGEAFVVRIIQNVIVGYVLIESKGDTIVLCKMATDPEYLRKGIGKFTIEWAKKFAKDQSFTQLLLHVRASNQPAINLYKKTEFKETKRIKNYYKTTGLYPKEKVAIEMRWICPN